MRNILFFTGIFCLSVNGWAQKIQPTSFDHYFAALRWRNIGPFRGGRVVTACGVINDPQVYYMGTTGGGVWKTENAGWSWFNISDGYFTTGSVGAVVICSRYDPHTFYSGGNCVFRTSDLGKTWEVISPDLTRHDTAHMGQSGIPFTNEGAGGENYCTLAYMAESPLEPGVRGRLYDRWGTAGG